MEGVRAIDAVSVAAFDAASGNSAAAAAGATEADAASAKKAKSATEIMSEIRSELKSGRRKIVHEIALQSGLGLEAKKAEQTAALAQKKAAQKSAMALAHAASAARREQSAQRKHLARKLKKRSKASNTFDANAAWWTEDEGADVERLAQTDVIVQLLRTPVALPAVGEILVVDPAAEVASSAGGTAPRLKKSSPSPERKRPGKQAPSPQRPTHGAPPPPVPAGPRGGLGEVHRIAPEGVFLFTVTF